MHLQLNYPEPVCIKEDVEKITGSKVKTRVATVRQQKYQEMVQLEKWQGKLMKNSWEDSYLD